MGNKIYRFMMISINKKSSPDKWGGGAKIKKQVLPLITKGIAAISPVQTNIIKAYELNIPAPLLPVAKFTDVRLFPIPLSHQK